MGMYDDLHCDLPLPDGYIPRGSFQTKSLGNELARYRITAQRRLVKETDGWFENRELETPQDMDHHGIIRFHDLETGEDDRNDRSKWTWREYDAKFTDGQCVLITTAPGKPAYARHPKE